MTEESQHLNDLTEIRKMMEKSSRFLSLSGLSGIFAGVYALLGAALVYFNSGNVYQSFIRVGEDGESQSKKLVFLISIGAVVLVISLLTAYFFSSRKAKREELPMWDKTAKLMLEALLTPLLVGGVLCLIFIYHEQYRFVAPLTLVFYGLALLNASKYTFKEAKFLSYAEICLGLLATYFFGSGLLFWAIGFGVLHILYGALMYLKYERS